jgi:hypothetical protein
MVARFFRARCCAVLVVSLTTLHLSADQAHAAMSITTGVRGAYGKIKTFEGMVGSGRTVTITYNKTGGGTGTVTATGGPLNRFSVDQPADIVPGSTASAVDTDGCTDAVLAAAGPINPLERTVYVAQAPSAVDVQGASFALGGGFTVRPVSYDDDPGSANYGDFVGSVDPTEFSMVGTGLPGAATFEIDTAISITPNLLPLLPVELGGGGGDTISVGPFNLSGTVHTDFAGSSPFTGTVQGTLMNNGDLVNMLDMTVTLNSNFGAINGNLQLAGLTIIPEPSASSMCGLAALSVLNFLRLRRRRTAFS